MSRKKKCRSCGNWFQPFSSLHRACSLECSLAVARQDAEKRERKKRQQDKERVKPRSKILEEAQRAFNAWIRWRDRDEPCIDCGEWGSDEAWKPGGQWDAGHYLSVGSHPELRFDEDNCHKQLKSCNGGSGKYAHKNRTVSEAYRERLIAKIGLDRVERLEGPNPPKKYSTDDLRAIRDHYRRKLREDKRAARE